MIQKFGLFGDSIFYADEKTQKIYFFMISCILFLKLILSPILAFSKFNSKIL